MRRNLVVFIIFVFVHFVGFSQSEYWKAVSDRERTLGVEHGFEQYETDVFQLELVKKSQTVSNISPKAALEYNFAPGDWLNIRDKDSLYQLGDITLKIRKVNDENWESYSTAWNRKPIVPLEQKDNTILAAAELNNSFSGTIPLRIRRFYEKLDNGLLLRFEIKNTTNEDIEIGALGVPMVFDNILEGRSLDEAHVKNFFFDPYIGLDAGYLEVKRLDGLGPVLLVLPGENMSFENYRPLLDDIGPKSVVFEGYHEWMAHSLAYAEKEWKGVEQWNNPTSKVLKPNEKVNYSLRFYIAPEIRKIKKRLLELGHPVAEGYPGYVLPNDIESELRIMHSVDIAKINIIPEGSLEVKEGSKTNGKYQSLLLKGQKWGRAKLILEFSDGHQQSIHYKIIKPEEEIVKDFGRFLFDKQWYSNDADLFGRSPSIISYDYETQSQVIEDGRAWVAGLSDEAGAGSWLGAFMKQLLIPNREELIKLEEFVDQTMWGNIQYNTGENKYGVKKSVFYYEPDNFPEGTYSDHINYGSWAAWSKKGADDPGRSYNYPHVTAAYWVMYRLARYHEGLVSNHDYKWYLKQAYETAMAMTKLAPYYAQFGQMEGTIFLLLLKDLENEQEHEMADELRKNMKKRTDHWRELNYPFGSEMPWDSTGQEEVFMWSDYFGYTDKAQVTLNAILTYMPSISHWAYNGNARRYWDFLYAGKLSRIERQIHHYGSGLNAIPLLKQYRSTPEDFHLLKSGYGGLLGAISNITEDGFGPNAFHSFPSTLQIDYLSGDYGTGFFGYAVNTSTYLVKNEENDWIAFGGKLIDSNGVKRIEFTTAGKNRFFLAPEKLWLELDAGKFDLIDYDPVNRELKITFKKADVHTPIAYLRSNKELGFKFERKMNSSYVIKFDENDKTIINIAL